MVQLLQEDCLLFSHGVWHHLLHTLAKTGSGSLFLVQHAGLDLVGRAEVAIRLHW